MYVDMHCHCHELGLDDIQKYVNTIKLVCVSDDLESSNKTLELARKTSIIPCVGIHPWEAHNYSVKHVEAIKELIKQNDIKCLGEIGLDKIFYPKTYEHQKEIFLEFLEIAREYNLLLNLHTAGTWREVYELLVKYDIEKAYFHWYTGPLNLIEELVSKGYFIGVNPAWKIQDKHRRVIEVVPLTNILTESDAPYKYKGLDMRPDLVVETIDYLSKVKNVDIEEAKQIVLNNFIRLLS